MKQRQYGTPSMAGQNWMKTVSLFRPL